MVPIAVDVIRGLVAHTPVPLVVMPSHSHSKVLKMSIERAEIFVVCLMGLIF